MKKSIIIAACLLLSACGKIGLGGQVSQLMGNWAELKLPEGCRPKQISAEEGAGVAVLCEDGRVFH